MAYAEDEDLQRSMITKVNTKWDHSKLVDVKGMLEQRSLLDSAPNTKTQFVTQNTRQSNTSKVKSNRSKFQTRQAATSGPQIEQSQSKNTYISTNPYLNVHD